MTSLTAEQLDAYAAAIYEICLADHWVSAAASPAAANNLGRRTLISACNPYSQSLSGLENARRHQQLGAAIVEHGYPYWPARGRSADHSWVEPGFLVQASLDAIDAWARQFGQHAVWSPPDRGSTAILRIYTRLCGGQQPQQWRGVRIEWVAADVAAEPAARSEQRTAT